MIGLLQRVTSAEVRVKERSIAKIGRGLLVLVGVEKHDTENSARRLAERLIGYRVFPDSNGKMNLSLIDINGEILLVPQFTLVADTNSGMRPSFHLAAEPGQGRQLFDSLCGYAEQRKLTVGRGEFGADMQVSLVNDGPVTFWLRVED
ncbi:MAG TPA: D-aminoacyl-tRNA deacylase [Gammaproteobacteria bacterium]|nr:D-aminoacyl-tRNA deacylase [Gammaproteobacteria bacterium]